MGNLLEKMSRLSLSEDTTKNEPKVDNNIVVNNENLNTPKRNFIADQILDPRSATLGIKRTPLILAKLNENERMENDTPLKAQPYLETDLDEEVVETEESKPLSEAEIDDSQVNISLTPDSESSQPPDDDSVFLEEEVPITDTISSMIFDDEIINVEGKILNSPAVSKIKKTFIYEDDSTPTSESTPIKLKAGRTPLALVSNNSSPIPSPLGGKPWRGFHEERIRLGLENTPPGPQPFLESVQSAPGKVGVRRAKKSWARANWAQDESLVI